MRVLQLTLVLGWLAPPDFAVAQGNQSDVSLRDQFDNITESWLARSKEMRSYDGLRTYCLVTPVRSEVDARIKEIHHYDSLILGQLNDPTIYLAASSKEQKKTYKDLYQMELEYSYKGFRSTMANVCEYRRDIEKNAAKLRNGMGDNSYDAKVLMIELEVEKYLNHIDKLVRRIDDHLHVIEFETQSD